MTVRQKIMAGMVFLFWLIGFNTIPVQAQERAHQAWSYNLAIYEVNVRQYTAAGTFDAFEEHLDRLQRMGVGILWFMPIHPIGVKNRLGTRGSYYSVRDYRAVNPEYGTMDDFKRLVQAAHERGMYVLIDWVANHTAWDNPLTVDHPEWYVHDVHGNFIAPPGTNWSDVIELDYTKPALRAYMIESMKYWVTEAGIDGFRCDAVDMVPTDFWQDAISELKSTRSDLFFLAEADGVEWHEAGFDMSYAWGLYGFGNGILKRIADGANTATHLSSYSYLEKGQYKGSAYRMYFTANHDENSWYGTTDELFGHADEPFAVLTATFNGMPLIYSGQEAGLDVRLPFFEKSRITWREDPMEDVYSRLLHLKKENQALWNADRGGALQRVLSSDNTAVFAYSREKDGDRVFVALNLSGDTRTITFTGTGFTGTYRDVFSDESINLAAGDTMVLSPWGYRVLSMDDGSTGWEEESDPAGFTLEQNMPNPLASFSRIIYTIDRPVNVSIRVYDVLGRSISTLVDRVESAGRHEITFSSDGLPGGVYFYQMQAGSFSATRRMIIVRG